jgi:hypothetical protein
MMVTNQFDHSELLPPVRRLDLWANCTTFFDDPTLASSLYPILSPVDVNNFRLFVDAINGAPPESVYDLPLAKYRESSAQWHDR